MNWEVRTMPCARSYFNGTLFKKNMTRFWPIWGLYLLIWMFMLPIALILENNVTMQFACRTVLEYIPSAGLGLSVVFGLLAAAAVWSYLFNNRSACLMHTLPIRREGLFLTNFLSGMTFMVAPNLVIFLLTLLAEAATGIVDVGALVMWFFAVSLMELFFFCFATFCAMCTGHILGLPVLYGVLNCLVVGLVYLIDLALERFVFGFVNVQGAYTFARWMTPVWNLTRNLEVRVEWTKDVMDPSTAWLSGLGYILVYVIFGLILAALALVLYRRRHMERAGDVITVPWMRPVFQYGVAFCCALAFGTLLFELFRHDLPDTAWTLLIFMMICGAAGYFAAKMLLEKSFRVFGSWKGCLPLLAALVVLTCAMEFDLTGYERRVPAAERVESVYVTGLDTMPYDKASWLQVSGTDPDKIQAVIDVHRAVVENKSFLEEQMGQWYQYQDVKGGYSVETRGCISFNLVYMMKDGSEIMRNYSGLPISTEDLSDPDTLTAKLNALINRPEVVEQNYDLSDRSADEIVEMTLTSYHFGDEDSGYRDTAISKDAYEKVFQAVMLDFQEGNLGRRYLLADDERMSNCFANDLEIVFYQKLDGANTVQEGESAVIIRDGDGPASTSVIEVDHYTTRNVVTIQTTAKHTLAALKEAGVLAEPVVLRTKGQFEALNDAWYESEKFGETRPDTNSEKYVWDILGG